ncbi:MAG: o-succinylbenzoate synthase [Actinobacteria bacterium]|nr:o-succinylbenzoate synthase [Actinomycetota bacterium]
MRIHSVELIPLRLPLVTPWHTIGGELNDRDVLLVHIETDGADGWGECAAFSTPFYSPEFVESALIVLRDRLAPLLTAASAVTSSGLSELFAPVAGHRMAKSALEMAVLDAELRTEGRSFAEFLGSERTVVPAGVAVGFQDSPSALVDAVAGYAAAGYRRVKLKVEQGRDLDHIEAVREQFPALSLQVDANGAYGRDDLGHLARFDGFGLSLIEQPLDAEDLVGHAAVAERLATPICLDESLVSLHSVETALALGACDVVNLKPGRVGGYHEAKRIHDWCVERSIPLWCGGMLETGLARAANIALASLPGFTLTGDLSGSDRFFRDDIITEPITVVNGELAVPTGAGFGVELDLDAIKHHRLG